MRTLSEADVTHIWYTLSGMNEKQKRLYLGSYAICLGYGGISALSRAVGTSRGCIQRGVAEVKAGNVYHEGDRCRAQGAGRKTIEEKHRKLILSMNCFSNSQLEEVLDIMRVIDKIVEKASYGDPMTNNAWINITIRSIDDEIYELIGVHYSHSSIKKIVRKLGYSLQKNQKYYQACVSHPKRDEQFQHIKARREDYLSTGDPIISIDTKAKEKLGDFIRAGLEYRKKKDPRRVLDHDFAFTYAQIYEGLDCPIPENMVDKRAFVIPYGIYCLNNNTGYVVLGIDHDTSEFAADAIKRWWNNQGKSQFPNAKRLLILADGGGSNRSRGWLWKIALQQLSDLLSIPIEMCHYPPGTSKFNPIERRLWSQVSHAWTAKPLKTLEIVRGYTLQTRTTTGLTVGCEINYNNYLTESEKKKASLSEKEFTEYQGIINNESYQNNVLITFLGNCDALLKWNYIIRPHEDAGRWTNYRIQS